MRALATGNTLWIQGGHKATMPQGNKAQENIYTKPCVVPNTQNKGSFSVCRVTDSQGHTPQGNILWIRGLRYCTTEELHKYPWGTKWYSIEPHIASLKKPSVYNNCVWQNLTKQEEEVEKIGGTWRGTDKGDKEDEQLRWERREGLEKEENDDIKVEKVQRKPYLMIFSMKLD